MSRDLTVEMVGTDADWPAVHALLHRAFDYMDGQIDPPSSLHKLSAHDLAMAADTGGCLLAFKGRTIVGCLFLSIEGSALAVSKLAVEPDRQGEGIGGALMQSAVMAGKALRKKVLRLQTRLELTENHAAFAKMGFRKVGETAHEGFDHPTSITMERQL